MNRFFSWATALQRHFFDCGRPENVHLAIDDELLREIALGGDFRGDNWSAAEAREDFVSAVREEIHQAGWDTTGSAALLGRCCFFVLAYSLIPPSKTHGPPDFFGTLRRLLGEAESRPLRRFPQGLNQIVFQSLWARLKQGAPIALPASDSDLGRNSWSGPHCNIRLVQAHAGLRELDLRAVTREVFEKRLDRGHELDPHDVFAQVEREASLLSAYAQRVIAHPGRRELAQSQLFSAWQKWRQSNDTRDRVASQELDSGRTSRRLFFEVDSNTGEISVFQGTRRLTEGHLVTALRRAARRRGAVLAVWDESEKGFAERSYGSRGDRLLLVLRSREADEVCSLAELGALAGPAFPIVARQAQGIPAGWLVLEFNAKPLALDPDNPWAWLLPLSWRLEGGLALDRRKRRWLEGAGPQLVLGEANTRVILDGHPQELDGCIRDLRHLERGEHILQVGLNDPVRLYICPALCSPEVDVEPAWSWNPAEAVWPRRGAAGSITLDGPRLCTPLVAVARQSDLDLAIRLRRGSGPTWLDLFGRPWEERGPLFSRWARRNAT